MEKIITLEELKERLKQGFHAEVLFNFRTGNYEVPTWWAEKDGTSNSHKTFKYPKVSVKVKNLIKLVYDK